MRRSPVVVVGVAALAAVVLAGCSSAPSTVSITYEHDGAERTVTAHPDEVECTETEASSLGTQGTQYSVRLSFGDDSLGSYGSAWVYDERIVYFTADTLDIEHDDGHVRVEAAPGVVKVVEHAATDGEPIGGDFDVDGAAEVEGSLTVDLVCTS